MIPQPSHELAGLFESKHVLATFVSLFAVAGAAAMLDACAAHPRGTSADAPPRERILLDAGWRFGRGDPAALETALDYDVRPLATHSDDGKVADARPEQVAQEATLLRSALKPWILPTANPLIADKRRWHARPAGDPGGGALYVRAGFDDGNWQKVDLPHDWAIAGPFLADGPFGGMGRLPNAGIGWYRRKLDVPVTDRGRSLFLDVDGAPPSGSMVISSVAGPTVTTRGASISRRMPFRAARTSSRSGSTVCPTRLAGIPAAASIVTSG